MNTIRLAGVSLTESVRYGGEIEKRLLGEFPDEIERIWTRTGTAEVATDPMGMEVSDVFITLKPRAGWKRGETQDELVAEMSRVLDGMPGMRSVFTQPIEMRMNEMIAGIRADVGIKLFGDDFATLRKKGDEIRTLVEKVPGATDVSVDQFTGLPVLDHRSGSRSSRPGRSRRAEDSGDGRVSRDAQGRRGRQGQLRFDLVVRL